MTGSEEKDFNGVPLTWTQVKLLAFQLCCLINIRGKQLNVHNVLLGV